MKIRGQILIERGIHSSVMDIENLDAGQAFSELPETYTIFITEKDFYGEGKALYPIERMHLVTNQFFDDGEQFERKSEGSE